MSFFHRPRAQKSRKRPDAALCHVGKLAPTQQINAVTSLLPWDDDVSVIEQQQKGGLPQPIRENPSFITKKKLSQ